MNHMKLQKELRQGGGEFKQTQNFKVLDQSRASAMQGVNHLQKLNNNSTVILSDNSQHNTSGIDGGHNFTRQP